MTGLGVAAWARSRRARSLILALGFAWFALAGILGIWTAARSSDAVGLLTTFCALSTAGLVTLYFAVVKR
jgi:hypothetical protein